MDRRELLKGLAVTPFGPRAADALAGVQATNADHSASARTYAPAHTGSCAPEICRRYLAGEEKAPGHRGCRRLVQPPA